MDEQFTYLLGRTFKVNECDADPDIISKVVQMQKENSLSNQQSEENLQACSLSHEAGMSNIESDGGCLGVSRKKNLKSKIANGIEPGESHTVRDPEQPITSKESLTEQDEMSLESESTNLEYDDPNLSVDPSIPEVTGDELTEGSTVDGSNGSNIIEMEVGESPHIAVEEDDYPVSSTSLNSVSNKINLLDYSQSEWKGTTHAAGCMRIGYSEAMATTGCSSMRKIRGDNYCGLRATSFQVLSQGLDVLRSWKQLEEIISIPDQLINNFNCSWLSQWSFAGRLSVAREGKIEKMRQCLKNFCDLIKMSRSIKENTHRVRHFLHYFNADNEGEISIFEAIKLLMINAAVKLRADSAQDIEVPQFSWLLFAREGSETPEELMKNHLNTVGDTGGLEQVEMCLLGYALNLTIRVIRPSQVQQQDFVTHYPDDHLDEWEMCNLIAEDDRHYNIIVP